MKKITLEMLKNTAEMLGIKVKYENLHPNLMGMADAETKTITLNAIYKNNRIQEKCIIAHEMGHIFYPPRPGHAKYYSTKFDYLDFDEQGSIKITVAQDELLAQDWAITVLMPSVEFNRIMKKGDMSISEIAEYFEVLPSFVKDRIAYYRRKERASGRKVRWRDLIKRV